MERRKEEKQYVIGLSNLLGNVLPRGELGREMEEKRGDV